MHLRKLFMMGVTIALLSYSQGKCSFVESEQSKITSAPAFAQKAKTKDGTEVTYEQRYNPNRKLAANFGPALREAIQNPGFKLVKFHSEPWKAIAFKDLPGDFIGGSVGSLFLKSVPYTAQVDSMKPSAFLDLAEFWGELTFKSETGESSNFWILFSLVQKDDLQ